MDHGQLNGGVEGRLSSATDPGGIEGIVRGLPGVREVRWIDPEALAALCEIEAEYEKCSLLPVRNLGVSACAARQKTLVLLKDSTFRQPSLPTVYLVEECAVRADDPALLAVEGKRYRIIGEEIIRPGTCYREKTISLSDTFVMFPERRSSAVVPSFFLLPPIAFPELEQPQHRLGIADVVSVSPSISSDEHLRRTFCFSLTNDLATLLVGFNWAQTTLA